MMVLPLSPTAIGVLSMLSGTAAFSVNDLIIKFLSGDYALHQVVLIRSVVALAMIVGVLMPLAGGLHQVRTSRPGLHLLRGLLVVVANFFFFTALSVMPLAEAVAISFVAPLLITGMSVVFLGERVGPRRWSAVVLGLIGVVVVLQPGTEAFRPEALLVLGGAACYAAMQLMTRRMRLTESAATFAFYIQFAFLMTSGAVGLALGDGRLASTDDGAVGFLLRAWVWPPTTDLLLMVVLGVVSGIGGYLISNGYRLLEAGLAAPLEYAALPLAVVWGMLIFGDWPDGAGWTGIALILGSGLYMMRREMQLARQAERRAG
jgi:drug/metabolite transporter (DMT)-like permease